MKTKSKVCFLYSFGIAKVTSAEENIVVLYKNDVLGCCDHGHLFGKALKIVLGPFWKIHLHFLEKFRIILVI